MSKKPKNSMESTTYATLGASSSKSEIHAALSAQAKGLYPSAFCSIWPDLFTQDQQYAYIVHADGVGTKAALAYIYWKETGDLSVWRDLAQDALVMNTDDVLCVGAAQGPFLFSSTIGRHARYISSEVLGALIEGTEAYIEQLNTWGIEAKLCGGETADLGDIVRSLVLDATLVHRIRRDQIIDNADIRAGDLIIGLASFGHTSYDYNYNSGIGSNGLTLARHLLLHKTYAQRYPESYDPTLTPNQAYRGPHRLQDPLPHTPLNIGRALLSPTRSYLPFMKKVLEAHRKAIHGLVHCTGGGQLKLLNHLTRPKGALHLIKDQLFEPPPHF